MAALPASYNQDRVPSEGDTSSRGKVLRLSTELQALPPCTCLAPWAHYRFTGKYALSGWTLSEQKASKHMALLLEPSKHIPPSAGVENINVPWRRSSHNTKSKSSCMYIQNAIHNQEPTDFIHSIAVHVW